MISDKVRPLTIASIAGPSAKPSCKHRERITHRFAIKPVRPSLNFRHKIGFCHHRYCSSLGRRAFRLARPPRFGQDLDELRLA